MYNKRSALAHLSQNYKKIGHPIAYSGISKIFDYYKGVLSVKDIENYLSQVLSYSIHKETTAQVVNPTFKYFKRFQVCIHIFVESLRKFTKM